MKKINPYKLFVSAIFVSLFMWASIDSIRYSHKHKTATGVITHSHPLSNGEQSSGQNHSHGDCAYISFSHRFANVTLPNILLAPALLLVLISIEKNVSFQRTFQSSTFQFGSRAPPVAA